MAVVSPLLTSPINVKGVSKSISSVNKNLNQTKSSFKQISEILVKKTKVRRQIFEDKIETKRRREFYSIRKEEEDRLEAPNIVKMGGPPQVLSLVQGSGRSFFGRILSTLGYLAAGWLLRNLPTWVGLGKEFVARIGRAGEIIKNFVTNTINVFKSTFQVLDSFKTNIVQFDLFDSSNRVKNSFDELKNAIDGMGTELENAIKLVTTPLTQTTEDGRQVGTYSGEEVPGLGTTSEDMGAYGQPSGGYATAGLSGVSKQRVGGDVEFLKEVKRVSQKYGIKEGDLLGLMASESGLDPSESNGSHVGLIQFSADSAKLVGTSQSALLGMSRAQQMKYVDKYFEYWKLPKGANAGQLYATVFAPAYASKDPNKVLYSSPSREYSSNKPLDSNKDGKITISEMGGRIEGKKKEFGISDNIEISTSQPSSPVKAISAGTMKLMPQTGSGGIIQGGSGSKGEAQYATHFHIDAKTANPTAEQLANIREVSFQAVKAMLARGSTVWFGNLKQYASKNDSTLRNQIAAEQRAHDARSSAAVDIQETNPNVKRTFPSQVGSATKFPFAVGEVYSRGGYGREAEIIGSNGITVSHGAAGSSASQISPSTSVAKPAQTSAPTKPAPAQVSPAPTQQRQQQVAQQITPERKPQDIVAVIPQPAAAPPQVGGAAPSSAPAAAPSMSGVLNNFIKQKLLLDLAYL